MLVGRILSCDALLDHYFRAQSADVHERGSDAVDRDGAVLGSHRAVVWVDFASVAWVADPRIFGAPGWRRTNI